MAFSRCLKVPQGLDFVPQGLAIFPQGWLNSPQGSDFRPRGMLDAVRQHRLYQNQVSSQASGCPKVHNSILCQNVLV